MPIHPQTKDHFGELVISDATYLRSVIRWLNERHAAWADITLVNETIMTDLGFDSSQMIYIEAMIADMQKLIDAANGTALSAGDPIEPHLRGLLGLD